MVDDEADSDGSGGDTDADDLRDAKYKTLTDDFADVELGTPPIAPDGGFAPGTPGPGASVPPADPRRFACLRGPCVHYMERETFFASGNPKETWEDGGLKDEDGNQIRQPNQIDRTCLVHPGTETELTDEMVFSCSKWLPMTPRQLRKRDRIRRRFYKNYPELDPAFVPKERLARRRLWGSQKHAPISSSPPLKSPPPAPSKS